MQKIIRRGTKKEAFKKTVITTPTQASDQSEIAKPTSEDTDQTVNNEESKTEI